VAAKENPQAADRAVRHGGFLMGENKEKQKNDQAYYFQKD